MERLTHLRCSGIKAGYWSPAKKEELIERLALYEDFEPDPETLKSFLNVGDSDVGTVFVCAIRYALGRSTYMPSIVIEVITPLLAALDTNALDVMERDIEDAKDKKALGNNQLDAPLWINFLYDIKRELSKRR